MNRTHESEIRLGDIVHLNSGSPALRVTEIVESFRVEWQNECGEMEQALFPRICVTLQSVPQVSTRDL